MVETTDKDLYRDEFVHFRWTDDLEGKKCFFANTIDGLINIVNGCYKAGNYYPCKKGQTNYPFKYESGEPDTPSKQHISMFAYYDPNYDVKWAAIHGKEIQYKGEADTEWFAVKDELRYSLLELGVNPFWRGWQFRVKPE